MARTHHGYDNAMDFTHKKWGMRYDRNDMSPILKYAAVGFCPNYCQHPMNSIYSNQMNLRYTKATSLNKFPKASRIFALCGGEHWTSCLYFPPDTHCIQRKHLSRDWNLPTPFHHNKSTWTWSSSKKSFSPFEPKIPTELLKFLRIQLYCHDVYF